MTEVRDDMQTQLAAAHAEVERLRAERDKAQQFADEVMGIGTPYLDGLTETQLERYAQLSPPEMFRLYEKACSELELEKEKHAAYVKEVTEIVLGQQREIAELRRGQWQPVEDGQYRDGANVWQVWQGMVGVKPAHTRGNIYAGKLPDGWQLVRLAPQQDEGEGDE